MDWSFLCFVLMKSFQTNGQRILEWLLDKICVKQDMKRFFLRAFLELFNSSSVLYPQLRCQEFARGQTRAL